MGLMQGVARAVREVLPASLARFSRHIAPEWVQEALSATGTASVRRRRLPAEQVLWLVVGMALLRNESIERVAALLGVALPASGRRPLVARSALTQARARLGEEPVEYLFSLTAAEWATRSGASRAWRGLSVYALDGSTLRVPDSRENWRAFGGQKGNGTRAGSAYPLVRVAALMAVRSHMLAGLAFGPYAQGEVTLAEGLWEKLPEGALVLVDRNFLIAGVLHGLECRGAHWLTRARKRLAYRSVERLGPRDERVEIEVTRHMRARSPQLPAVLHARAVRYQRRGFRPSVLLTSLLDAHAYPAEELVALYHERWEIELGYDELKTHLLAREEALRSRTPAGVRQEVWGVALAYNLVRVEMERAADEAGLEPRRLSFTNSLSLIRTAWLVWSTEPLAPARIPAALLDLRRHLQLLVLPERRPERSYPRAVKIKMSSYVKKRPRGRGRN
jgi:hypothetical protein